MSQNSTPLAAANSASAGTDGQTGPSLEATIAIEPNRTLDCPLFAGDEIDQLRQSLSFESTDIAKAETAESETERVAETTEGTCNTALASGADGEGTYVRSQIRPGCFCLQFHQVECIPTFERTSHGSVIVTVQVPDREVLRELIERLRQTDAHVSVRGISQTGGEADGTIRIDTAEVTEKQLEALEVAVETGYYDTPRGADLDVLADRLGVSKSAVSQRLKAVESRFARKLVSTWTGR